VAFEVARLPPTPYQEHFMSFYSLRSQFERGMALLVYRMAEERHFDNSVLSNDERTFMFYMDQATVDMNESARLDALKKATIAALTDDQVKALGLKEGR
jgi:hypothetical protein